jgi:hypothetical protein
MLSTRFSPQAIMVLANVVVATIIMGCAPAPSPRTEFPTIPPSIVQATALPTIVQPTIPLTIARPTAAPTLVIPTPVPPSPTGPSTQTPTLKPTEPPTQKPGDPTPLPGWVMYDDFASTGESLKRWNFNKDQVCDLPVDQGFLSLKCDNKTNDERHPGLDANRDPGDVIGIGVGAMVEDSSEPLEMAIRWKCATAETDREYHLEFSPANITAAEYYPARGWTKRTLGMVSAKANQLYELRIERSGDTMQFKVNGQRMDLQTPPDYSSCSRAIQMGFSLFVPRGGLLKGKIDWVQLRLAVAN